MIPFREREGVRRKFLFLLFSCLLSVSLSAQTYQELSEKAVECVGKDSLVQAEDLLKQALKLEPKNAHNALLFSNLGLVQRKLGRYNDAVESYTYALNIAPLAVPILLNRAAIYLDQGYDRCKQFMEKKIFKNYIDLDKMSRKEVNFKSKLIEWSQKNKMEVSFELIEQFLDEEYNPMFHTEVRIEGISAGTGTGYSKKESQQNAAQMALKKIKDAAFKEEVQAAKERNHATETSTEENPMAEAVEESPQEKLAETDSHPTSLDN